MKIGGKKPGGVGGSGFVKKTGAADGAGKTQDASKAGGKSSGDSVDLSPKAKELVRAKSLLDDVPDLRTEKVVKLKNDIEDGSYQVDSGKVAEKMIERAVMDAIHQKKR